MKITLTDGKEFAELMKQAVYTHAQDLALTTWTITHNLGKYPSIVCINSSGEVILGNVVYVTINQITVEFLTNTSGKAFLN